MSATAAYHQLVAMSATTSSLSSTMESINGAGLDMLAKAAIATATTSSLKKRKAQPPRRLRHRPLPQISSVMK
jgi:hypothetical protein